MSRVIVVDLDATTIARTRLAPSPLTEVVTCLGRAVAGWSDPRFGSLVSRARSSLSHPDVRLVAEVMPHQCVGYIPDCLMPKPDRSRDVMSAQLEAVASTPTDEVHRQLDEHLNGWRLGADHGVPARSREVLLAVEQGTFAARAAAGLARLWNEVFRDDWAELRRMITGDLQYRAVQVAGGGVEHMFNGLHPRLQLQASQLRIRLGDCVAHTELTDSEIVLTPGLLGGSTLLVGLDSPDQAMIRYPALIDDRGRQRRSGRIERLMGATRAAILEALDWPSTSGDIARSQHISPATASYHLGVLHDAGLVHRSRDGMSVIYSRTSHGHAVVGHAGA